MELTRELASAPLFRNLDPEEAAALREICFLREFPRGETLFTAGDPATEFFLLLDGTVRISKVSPEGREVTWHLVRRDHLFAEAAVFGSGVYPASAVAVENARVAVFPAEAFVEVVKRHPTVALKIIVSLSSWVREFARMLEDRTLKEVPARVASFLLGERGRKGAEAFRLDQSKSLAAEQMGMTSESFSRALRRLQDRGLIAVRGREFSILDAAGLEEAAEERKRDG